MFPLKHKLNDAWKKGVENGESSIRTMGIWKSGYVQYYYIFTREMRIERRYEVQFHFIKIKEDYALF
jgi:hypothetical protein